MNPSVHLDFQKSSLSMDDFWMISYIGCMGITHMCHNPSQTDAQHSFQAVLRPALLLRICSIRLMCYLLQGLKVQDRCLADEGWMKRQQQQNGPMLGSLRMETHDRSEFADAVSSGTANLFEFLFLFQISDQSVLHCLYNNLIVL